MKLQKNIKEWIAYIVVGILLIAFIGGASVAFSHASEDPFNVFVGVVLAVVVIVAVIYYCKFLLPKK